MCTINDSYMMYTEVKVQWKEFFVILDWSLPFYPPNNTKDQNFEKMIKTPGDMIILHRFTINDNHIMYGSWDMKRDEQNFLSFWTIFYPFTCLTTQKIKISKTRKKCREILSLYDVWFLRYEASFYSNKPNKQTLTNQKIEILKNWKKRLEISSFYTSVPKIMVICYNVP